MKRTSKTCSELFRFISYTILNNYYNWLLSLIIIGPIGYKIGDGITYLFKYNLSICRTSSWTYIRWVVFNNCSYWHIIASTLLKRAYSQIKISVSISYSLFGQWRTLHRRCYFSCLFQNKTKEICSSFSILNYRTSYLLSI